jgi:GMP synthase-like glutamine amidotransferase
MTGTRILVVQPAADDPLGTLEQWLTEAGAELTVCAAFREPVPPNLDEYDGLVVLGGGMSALDDVECPWLADVRALLAAAVTRQLPVLAICLGAQLLAAALGGRTRKMPNGPEAGTGLVAKRDAAVEDPLWGPMPFTPDVIQFHSDEVHTLPSGAVLLASSPHCANQAYRIGARCYAVQFHIETTPEVVNAWVKADPEIAASAPRGKLDVANVAQVHDEIAETWKPFIQRFVELVSGEISTVPRLPLV